MMKTKTNVALVSIFLSAVLSIVSMLYASPVFASNFYQDVQLNFTLDGKRWGLGGRFHDEQQLKHYVLRFKPAQRWLTQFRYVVSEQNKQRERRFRVRHKSFRYGDFEFNTAFEYRQRSANSNTLRFRPQLMYQYKVTQQLALFYQITPHWVYDFDKGGIDYRFARHKYGLTVKFDNHDKVNLFVKTKTGANWTEQESFLGLDYAIKF